MSPAAARDLRPGECESNIANGNGHGGSTPGRLVSLCHHILRTGSRCGDIELSTFQINWQQTQMGHEGIDHFQALTATASFEIVIEPRPDDFDMVIQSRCLITSVLSPTV